MKKVISSIIFITLTIGLILLLTDISIPKTLNRYYILDRYLAQNDTDRDVQVFGSCHAYSSFDPSVLEENTGLTSFVYASPGEIIPTTYVRMLEQFQRHTPEVAVVEIWGINPYETYDSTEKILQEYMPLNVQMLPYSKEKAELVSDFADLDPLEMHFPLSQYKSRFLDGSLIGLDFKYRFEDMTIFTENFVTDQMALRLKMAGFAPHTVSDVSNYPEMQNHVAEDDVLEIEPVIVKYIEKIIALCEEYDVQLIFYRAPYVSTENELRKLNHFRQICAQYDVTFIDLEQMLELDYTSDLNDLYHLSYKGAVKATECLQSYITAAIQSK